MVERIFLGWNEPFVGRVADWLLGSNKPLEQALIIVPTSQSARQLKHLLASKAGALLSPKFSTPGALMRMDDADIAPNWLEILAWQEVLENQTPQQTLEALFSDSLQTQGEWAGGLASELVSLRRTLQDNGLNLRDVARRLGATLESDRWEALARIESMVEAWLRSQGYRSRTLALQNGVQLPDGIHEVILAGISELPPLVERTLKESPFKLTCLIAAPQHFAQHFSEIGTPLSSWNDLAVDWPSQSGSVEVATDPRQQARLARALVAHARTDADDLALGTADSEAGDLLADEFTRAGWPTHHPASMVPAYGLRRWLNSWSQWLVQADLSAVMNLLCSPLTSALIEADCATIANHLACLRDRWMVFRPDDLRHQLKHGNHRSLKSEALEVIRACEKLEQWRKLCEQGGKADALRHLIDALKTEDAQTFEIQDWIDQAARQMNASTRSLGYWIDLMLSDLPKPGSVPPSDRVLDVHGWLELLFQPGSHLILCSLNEGKIPATGSDDPWLGESGRALLELHTNKQRAARDAFLLQSMIQSRIQSAGRVDMLCTRTNTKGEPQLPSRLLLAAQPEQIAPRVEKLFRDLEPPDAKLRWDAQPAARWTPPKADVPATLNATSFRDYLACPFRYSLKHVHKMSASEPDRIEWNARDFGNVIHEVLEAWGKDPSARELEDADEIYHWLNHRLDEAVQAAFNQRIPLAVRIQLDSIRQRLAWFSQCQQDLTGEGWQVIEVEHKFEIPIGQTTVRAKIDRIDRHRESGQLRIIDYKTGSKTDPPAAAHRTRKSANSKLPAHIAEDDPALYTRDDGKKPTTYLWKDLQLPLYVLAIQARDKQLATPCYFKLGDTRNDAALMPWEDFDGQDLEAAEACALWVSKRITAGQFWPIAEKVTFDDYELLWCSHKSEDVISGVEPVA